MRKLCLILAAMLFFGNGAVPAAETTEYEKAGVDLMLIVTHPGDEYLYLGGVLPYYVSEKGYTALVVYMTSEDAQERTEATLALKALGVSEDPVFGDFNGTYSESVEEIQSVWGATSTRTFLVKLIREYRPAVIVSHDEAYGEYGDAANIFTAEQTRYAVRDATRANFDTESAEAYGTWQVQRLFLHFEEDDPITIDRDAPLAVFGGRSAAEVEEDAYNTFSKKYRDARSVTDPTYSVGEYGLAVSAEQLTVKPENNDFFYGIDPEMLNGPGTDHWVSAALSTDQPDPVEYPDDYYFLQEGDPDEVVSMDWENEHWEYRTDTLSIIIDRYHTETIKGYPLTYCVAHVRMREEDAFRAMTYRVEKGIAVLEMPLEISREYSAVLAITGDNLNVIDRELKGIIIRNGKVYNRLKEADTFVLLPDLTMKIYSPGETTAEQLLEEGVTQAFSFGPTLIRDSVVNFRAWRDGIGGLNPRTGIGMIEPGHFVVITVDGRLPTYSVGVKLQTFGYMFYRLGCTQAYNLDGGSSTAMMFMGEYLNRHDKIEGQGPGQRTLPDMLLWGESDLVPEVGDPVVTDVYTKGD